MSERRIKERLDGVCQPSMTILRKKMKPQKETKVRHKILVTPMYRSLVKGRGKEVTVGPVTVGLFMQPA